nr:MAG TPA: hypothetical protein [Caudoviricetes sp.]
MDHRNVFVCALRFPTEAGNGSKFVHNASAHCLSDAL